MERETEKALVGAKLESISACEKVSSAPLKFIILIRRGNLAKGEEIQTVQEEWRKRVRTVQSYSHRNGVSPLLE